MTDSAKAPEERANADSSPAGPSRPQVAKGRARPRRPDLDSLFSIHPDGSRNAIQPADCHGRFQTRKHLLWWVLIAVYLALPWIRIGGHPAFLIDIEHRHFFLLGRTFNAQDFWLAFFLVSGAGFTLFLVAALWGRLWCGYACPQTVFLEGLFRRIERWIEGPAPARAKLDRSGFHGEKVLRRGAKLAIYLLLALVITHSLLGYFMPVEQVVAAMSSSPAHHPTAFLFIIVLTLLVFVNFTWFREQTCIVVCPYGRLQGALYDPDTLLVGYDQRRGEPRGAAGTAAAGDCVDCFRCVAVCPTGIDIRNGTQMECIGCANCIDACDDVMQKLGRPVGLVRYDSQRGFDGGGRRFWRPRVFLYAFLFVLGSTVFGLATGRRTPFEANLIRPPGAAFVIEGERVRNLLQLHLVNKLAAAATFTVEAEGPDGAEITIAQREVRIESLEDQRIPVVVQIPTGSFVPGSELRLRVRTVGADGPVEMTACGTLLGPRRLR